MPEEWGNRTRDGVEDMLDVGPPPPKLLSMTHGFEFVEHSTMVAIAEANSRGVVDLTP